MLLDSHYHLDGEERLGREILAEIQDLIDVIVDTLVELLPDNGGPAGRFDRFVGDSICAEISGEDTASPVQFTWLLKQMSALIETRNTVTIDDFLELVLFSGWTHEGGQLLHDGD